MGIHFGLVYVKYVINCLHIGLFCVVVWTSNLEALTFDCQQDLSIYQCEHHIPATIPYGVFEVHIKDYNHDLLSLPKTFRGLRWQHVTKLDITVNWKIKNLWIRGNNFVPLTNLTYLGIHTPELFRIELNGFAGLKSLEYLDLSYCTLLRSIDVTRVLEQHDQLPKLRFLNLKALETTSRVSFIINEKFSRMIHTKKIETLILSGTNIVYTPIKIVSPVKYLDISNTSLFAYDIEYRWSDFIIFVLQNVETFNISYVPSRVFGLSNLKIHNYTSSESFCHELTRIEIKLMTLDLSYVYGSVLINNCTLNMSDCYQFNNLEVLMFRGNNIKKLNATLHLPKNMHLLELDLSFNKIVYISPNILRDCSSLNTFNLNNNKLVNMEHDPEFEYLFSNLHNLKDLNLAKNNLSYIPYRTFSSNTALQTLNLFGNNLKSITFQIKHLTLLKILNLGENQIHFLENSDVIEITDMLSYHQDYIEKLHIEFKGNPLICSCESVDFMLMIINISENNIISNCSSHHQYQCAIESKLIDIDTKAIESAKYLCYRQTIKIICIFIVMCSIFLFILITIVIVKMVKVKKRNDLTAQFLSEMKQETLNERFLVFLSYCCDDSDLVMPHIYPKLEQTLKRTSGINRELVCIGDRHFRPGMSLFNEITRCITESCVVIFVVSQAFCASGWCRNEVREAYEQNKPIILFFKEEVDMILMPPHLKTIFQRYTRVKIIRRNVKYEIVPTFTQVCESIINLASQIYDEQKKLKGACEDAMSLKNNNIDSIDITGSEQWKNKTMCPWNMDAPNE